MLQHLSIRNYALIDQLEISFESGLNILTGETGSGKSIILGALGLILGDRSDVKAVAKGSKKCIVEGTFALEETPWMKRLEDLDVDYEPATRFRREITETGKSRAFINDTPVSLKVMRELGMALVDLHSQHTTIQINEPDFQLRIIDGFADLKEELADYREIYAEGTRAARDLKEAEQALVKSRGERDFLNFQLGELHGANLDEYDEAEIEDEYNKLAHAEEIARKLHAAIAMLDTDDKAAAVGLDGGVDAVTDLADWSKTYSEWKQRLQSAAIEIREVVREMESHVEDVQVDPKRLADLDEKRAAIFNLERKHNVVGAEELRRLRDELQGRVAGTEELEAKVESLGAQLGKIEREIEEKAARLTKKRKSVLKDFAAAITETLTRLNMESARFDVEISALDKPGPRGADVVEMLFSSNKGHQPQPLKRVASGGELSRLMLAIKKAASGTSAATIVLDEIDTGVSGEVANAMGLLMREMGENRQVLSITHLPQIAAKGRTHFKVFKTEENGVAQTRIDRLDADQRILEIAQMLSGARTTPTAMNNARELLREN